MLSVFRCALLIILIAMPLSLFAADGKNDEQKWDVTNFTDQTYEIGIDTDEGTWMSVHVSPDGKQIVFDLLGDIYVLPITGGEAHLLAGGPAWETQPRFSPDGQRIAFTSDRAGGDNIWTMARDGSDARQVSKETFRLLNSPAWSPDGNYLVGRKHFTSARSLGAGEIWMYHTSGGGGIQLNEKPNKEKDLGEPAFSPDGRYVYFSQDTTPGPRFEYDKDPNLGIYSIRRIDLQKGGIETVIRGAGGAIRPTPSPSGKFLAYIRRHNYETKLWLHELENGRNWIVYDKLDHDMQETWAIYGVYPGISWTPDEKSLVFWAGGKIHNFHIPTAKDTVIPFHIKTRHTMVKTLRQPVEVAPDTFEAKMLRQVKVSPDGSKVVFQTLGNLYIRDLPDGEPRRLTGQKVHFEYFPSWSWDSQSIVYVAWHDESLGSIRIASASGGEGRVLTRKPGHYRSPCLSPDGKTLVYEKGQGGYLTSPLWSTEPGLYVLQVDGGEPLRLSKRGFAPHFIQTGKRIFFSTVDEGAKRTLRSVDFDGQHERAHVESAMGQELAIAPDGKWLAFAEDWRVYVGPFTLTSKVFSLGPKAKNIPVRQVSADSGHGLHWSKSSDQLYWSLGNQLYTRTMRETFSFAEGASAELPPVTEGRTIGFTVPSDKPIGVTALVGARIITMKGDEVIENGTILIEDNRILAIGPQNKVKVPRGAFKLDVSNQTIIPGLIDVHAHGGHGAGGIIPQQNWVGYATLTFGVTTTHDPSNDTATIFAASEMVRAGKIVGPRIFSTGTIIYGATAPGLTASIDSLADARMHLRRLKAAGAFSVKSYNQPRRDQRQQIIAAARAEDMIVVPEGGSLLFQDLSMIADGHTGIEHNIPPSAIYSDVVQFWSQSGTQYTPTLVVAFGGMQGEIFWYENHDVWAHERLSQNVPPFLLASKRRRTKAPLVEYNHIRVAEVCKKLTNAGVRVNLGAHGQREGLAAHWEMWMMGQGGMTPMECLRAGTANGARYLGFDRDLGSLEVGKLADLVVLKKNPLENIQHTDSTAYVMVNGRLYNAETMHETGNHPKIRKPFYWTASGAGAPSGTSATDSAAMCHGCTRH